MELRIEYCTAWNYLPKAVSMASDVLSKCVTQVSGLMLVPSGGGAFEITLNGNLIYSKLETGQFPTADHIIALVRAGS